MISRRLVEPFLREFDSEDRELIVRWRMWKMEWFPYRTRQFLGYDKETLEMHLGPTKWHRPRKLTHP